MYLIADGLARLLAPVLSFTMDELWRNLPGQREPSVHLALFPSGLADWRDPALLERWERLRAIRDQVNLALEAARQDKSIAANLSAHVDLSVDDEWTGTLGPYRDALPSLFGVSTTALHRQDDGVKVAVTRAEGIKCERCWRIVPSVSDSPAVKGLCERCVGALTDPGVARTP
jgi:isoleucyl-tRNA synthetase